MEFFIAAAKPTKRWGRAVRLECGSSSSNSNTAVFSLGMKLVVYLNVVLCNPYPLLEYRLSFVEVILAKDVINIRRAP